MRDRLLQSLILLVLFLAVVLLAYWPFRAKAQDHHIQGHDAYQEWASKRTQNRCHGTEHGGDCRHLMDSELRESEEGYEVKIGIKWCPVKEEHVITKGRSADWSRAHACINQNTNYGDPCAALLCFVGPPKI